MWHSQMYNLPEGRSMIGRGPPSAYAGGHHTSLMSANPHPAAAQVPVPQLDLAAQYATIGEEIRAAVERVLASQQFVLGREGAALEEEIARLCNVAHGLGHRCADARAARLRRGRWR